MINKFLATEYGKDGKPMRVFELNFPAFGQPYWRRNVCAYDTFRKREQMRTTSSTTWHKKGGGVWYRLQATCDFESMQNAFLHSAKRVKLPELQPNHMHVFMYAVPVVKCASMAEFCDVIGYDRQRRKFGPESLVIS